MTRFILSLLTIITFSAANSQKQYFVYLQSDPEQAFFVKLNEKIHSSSSTGYLILSKLHDTAYTFTVGFPQNKWPEQKFTVEMKAKDHGYLLKNFGEKGWGLFDLQTLSVQMGQFVAGNIPKRTEQKEVSPFTDILSKAANDPSLKERPIVAVSTDEKRPVVTQAVKKEEVQEPPQVVKKQDPPPVVQKEEQTVTKKDDTPVTREPVVEKKEETKTIPAEEYRRSVVTKKSESSTSEGLGITYLDEYGNGKKDTIRIIIPGPRTNTEIKEQPKDDKKFLDISATDTSGNINEGAVKNAQAETLPAKPVSKSKCSSVATESDFLKLRKKMAAGKGDDNMVNEAKKYFKTKCFAVTQLKNLSTLFLDDGGKYKFFDASYAYVSDSENFSSLVAEIKDEYYINRFKAMLR